jgi:hypothetical protein
MPCGSARRPNAGRRNVMRFVLVAASGWLSAPPAMARAEVRALTSDDTPATRHVVETLSRRFAGLVVGSDVGSLARRNGRAIYLSVGPAALQQAIASDLQASVVSLFTSSQAFNRIMAGSASSSRRTLTAIYAEASPAHQLRLISAIFQRRVSVGVLLTEGTAHLEPLLARAARDADLELQVRHVAPGANIVRELNRVGSSTVVLALPDASLYSADNVRSILESTYRRAQPVVGFSQGMVAAGALASAYSSVEDVVAQAEELVAELEAGRTPEPRYPAYWRVAINDSVARSLNLVIGDNVRTLGDRPPLRTR